MQLFYAPDLQGEHYVMNEEESKHCIKVLRLKSGDRILLTDGKGNISEGQINTSESKKVSVNIESTRKDSLKSNYRLHIAMAPTKSIERFEWFLEKATEIGIDEITPIVTEHSERKSIRPDRLEKIIIAAMKQSVKAYKPILNPLIGFKEFIHKEFGTDELFIAHCQESEKADLKNLYQCGSNVVILIGSEGDFSEPEIRDATDQNFKAVSLGEYRLRTETAGIVACHAIHLLNQLK